MTANAAYSARVRPRFGEDRDIDDLGRGHSLRPSHGREASPVQPEPSGRRRVAGATARPVAVPEARVSGGQAPAPAGQREFRLIEISALDAPVDLVRQSPQLEELRALAQSIRDHGFNQPILVRRVTADRYRIVAGFRRWRAAAMAGVAKIPAVVVNGIEDSRALELSLAENLQRSNLTVIEEARAYELLIRKYRQPHSRIAAIAGKSRSHVSNVVRLLSLPNTVKARVQCGEISFGHARALLSSSDPEGLAVTVVDQQLSVRETEQLIRRLSSPEVEPDPAEPSAAVDVHSGELPAASPPVDRRSDPSHGVAPAQEGPQVSGLAFEHDDPQIAKLKAITRELGNTLGRKVEVVEAGGHWIIGIVSDSPDSALTVATSLQDALWQRRMEKFLGS